MKKNYIIAKSGASYDVCTAIQGWTFSYEDKDDAIEYVDSRNYGEAVVEVEMDENLVDIDYRVIYVNKTPSTGDKLAVAKRQLTEKRDQVAALEMLNALEEGFNESVDAEFMDKFYNVPFEIRWGDYEITMPMHPLTYDGITDLLENYLTDILDA